MAFFGDFLAPIGLGALVGGPIGAGVGAQYAGQMQAAEAQQRIAESQLAEARTTRTLAMNAATPTTNELTALNQQLELQSRAIGRQEQLLNSLDPALIQAGRQALALLSGQESSALAPLRAERQRQRQELVNSLLAGRGAGGTLDSAGTEALNRFDAQTAQVLGQQQQQTLGSLLGVVQGSRPDPYQAVASNAQSAALLGRPSERMVSAITATPITPYAGAQFVQQGLQGQAIAGIGQAVTNVGAQGLGYALGGGLGGLGSSRVGA